MEDWRKEFQYLLDRKILSRDELGFLFGQIKSIVDSKTQQLQAELKGKDEALKIAREAMALASEMYFYEKKGIDKMLCEQGDIIDNILKGIKR